MEEQPELEFVEDSYSLRDMVFIGEIVTQIKIAKLASDRLAPSTDSIEIWSAIQSILIATGNVSKILWPSNKKSKARGDRLRRFLAVEGGSCLKDRKFRNHFEHYDERIDEWLNNTKSSNYTDLKINPFEKSPMQQAMICHREYNPETRTLTFRDDIIEIGEVLHEFDLLLAKCKDYVLV